MATEVGGVVDIIENNKTGLSLLLTSDTIRSYWIFKDPQLALSLSQAAIDTVKEKYNISDG